MYFRLYKNPKYFDEFAKTSLEQRKQLHIFDNLDDKRGKIINKLYI